MVSKKILVVVSGLNTNDGYIYGINEVLRVLLAKRSWLCFDCNSDNIVFGYEISRDFYAWAIPLFALKTLFC